MPSNGTGNFSEAVHSEINYIRMLGDNYPGANHKL